MSEIISKVRQQKLYLRVLVRGVLCHKLVC